MLKTSKDAGFEENKQSRSSMGQLTRREVIRLGVGSAFAIFAVPSLEALPQRPSQMVLPASVRTTFPQDSNWHTHSAGIAAFKDRLVVTFHSGMRRTSVTRIMTAYSLDQGKTWSTPKLISMLGWNPDHACWVSPQLTHLHDGRLVMICDRGNKLWATDAPMLSQWQKPPRGMANFLFFSEDEGKTWTKPRQIDNVGGEPSYIVELSNGSWMFTRTDSRPTTAIKNPVLPWGPNYYRSVAVFSDDKGKTWPRTSVLADEPLAGDCEVGTVEVEPGHLLAITRIGDANGRYGQPSRFVHSYDYGKTWKTPEMSPIYAQRPIVRKMADGKLLVTYRHAWGTTGTWALIFDPKENPGFQPASFIWEDSRCRLAGDAMEIRTADGVPNAVEFSLYPVEDDDSAVDLEAELMVKEAEPEGCLLSAGAWVRLTPGRVCLADRPSEGFDCDTSHWHKYHLDFAGGVLIISVDGKPRLKTSTASIFTRAVRFGNRHHGEAVGPIAKHLTAAARSRELRAPKKTHLPAGLRYKQNQSHTFWRSVSFHVRNRRDLSVAWSWQAASKIFPDQFRRDREVVVGRNGCFARGSSGYSGWDQMADGRIAIADYNCGNPPLPLPVLRVYVAPETDLLPTSSPRSEHKA